MKYCAKCGQKLEENTKFCSSCGEPVNSNENTYQNYNQGYNNYPKIERKEIAIAIILSIVTCGIYGIIWFIKMTDDANTVSNENGTSGGMAFLWCLLTCGIYTIYWNYKMGQKLYEAGQRTGKNISDNAILYLILSILGLSMVNWCLIQSDLNKFAN